jgi:hypothetical protein
MPQLRRMARRFTSRTGPQPWKIYHHVCRCFGLSSAQEWLLWHALRDARWSDAVHLRTVLEQFDRGPDRDPEVFWHERLTPAVVTRALEALAHEGKLARHKASAIQDVIFAHMDQQGCWRPRAPVHRH